MIKIFKKFLKDLTDFNNDESVQEEDEQNAGKMPVTRDPIIKAKEIADKQLSVSIDEPEPQLSHCSVCGKAITSNETCGRLKTEIERFISEYNQLGCECDIELHCHQCACSLGTGQQLALQPVHFCFCWGNRDWNKELREIARYYGEEYAQQCRGDHKDLRHKVIADNIDEYKVMLQVLRRMTFRYSRKDITALLTEPEKRVYEKFTGKKSKSHESDIP